MRGSWYHDSGALGILAESIGEETQARCVLDDLTEELTYPEDVSEIVQQYLQDAADYTLDCDMINAINTSRATVGRHEEWLQSLAGEGTEMRRPEKISTIGDVRYTLDPTVHEPDRYLEAPENARVELRRGAVGLALADAAALAEREQPYENCTGDKGEQYGALLAIVRDFLYAKGFSRRDAATGAVELHNSLRDTSKEGRRNYG